MTAAVILAGGQSTRMGRDKALIQVDGQSLLMRTCGVAQGLGLPIYVVTPWSDRYRDQVPSGCRFMSDESEAQGPLVALGQAWRSLPEAQDWVLLLACDLPCLTAAALHPHVAQLPDRLPSTGVAWLPRRGDRWEPLCGFYHRAGQLALEAYIAQGGRSFQGWLATVIVQELPLSDRTILFNCNSPEDLANRPHG
ncbi:MAG: molybdenum cofactor guanylyltransferase [Leptolyngbya sp. DLM2.Bin15]|nr:MAG: molybdenum cofactor guanylyltransferase [Leptolyngbya sp. DLM2.Bin15]